MAKPVVTSPKIPVACFAPPLTDELLAAYRAIITHVANGEIRDAMDACLKCVEAWWALPESTRQDVERWATLHKGAEKTYTVTPLEEAHIASLFDVTPWMRELDTLSNSAGTGLFDGIPAGDVRNAAFHLLWYAKEITLDREPVTQDCLK